METIVIKPIAIAMNLNMSNSIWIVELYKITVRLVDRINKSICLKV